MGTHIPPRKGAQQSHTFQTMSIVAKWSLISATAELLFINAITFLPRDAMLARY